MGFGHPPPPPSPSGPSFRQGRSLAVARCSSLLCLVSAMQQCFILAQPPSGPFSSFPIDPLTDTCFGILSEMRDFLTRVLMVIVFVSVQHPLLQLRVYQTGLLRFQYYFLLFLKWLVSQVIST